MNTKYDLAVVIGRFQPVHNGHVALIREAKQIADKVLVLIGSAGQPRSYENPFSYELRDRMICNTQQDGPSSLVYTAPLYDNIYNDNAWATQVQDLVGEHSGGG